MRCNPRNSNRTVKYTAKTPRMHTACDRLPGHSMGRWRQDQRSMTADTKFTTEARIHAGSANSDICRSLGEIWSGAPTCSRDCRSPPPSRYRPRSRMPSGATSPDRIQMSSCGSPTWKAGVQLADGNCTPGCVNALVCLRKPLLQEIMRATDVSVKVLGVPVRYSPVYCEQLQIQHSNTTSCTTLANDPEEKHDPSKAVQRIDRRSDVHVPARAAHPGRGALRCAISPNIGSYELPASSHDLAPNSVMLIPNARAIVSAGPAAGTRQRPMLQIAQSYCCSPFEQTP